MFLFCAGSEEGRAHVGLFRGPAFAFAVHPASRGQRHREQDPVHPHQDHQRRQPYPDHVQLGTSAAKLHGKDSASILLYKPMR